MAITQVMAKPIVVLTLNAQKAENADFKQIKEAVSEIVEHEYHVLIIKDSGAKTAKVDVYNADHCPDADIRQLERLIESKWPAPSEQNT